jgi:hypothetical protein
MEVYDERKGYYTEGEKLYQIRINDKIGFIDEAGQVVMSLSSIRSSIFPKVISG